MKFRVGARDSALMSRFNIESRHVLYHRIEAITHMLRAYFVYFALNNHEETLKQLKEYFGPGAPRLLKVFSGELEVAGGFQYGAVDEIKDAGIQAFVKTLMEVSKYKRL